MAMRRDASAHRLRNRLERRGPETPEPGAPHADVRRGADAKLERQIHDLPAVHRLGTGSLCTARGTDAAGWHVTNVARDPRASVSDAIAPIRQPDALPGPVSFDPDGVEHAAASVHQVWSSAVRHVEAILSTGAKDAPVTASQ